MAFTINKVFFYRKELNGGNTKRRTQVVEIEFSRGSADVSIDLFNPTGTFWSSAKANVTNGEFVKGVISNFGGLTNAADGLLSIEILASNGFLTQTPNAVAPAAATEYRLTNAGTYPVCQPVITLFANAAPASVRICAEFTLKPEQYGISQ